MIVGERERAPKERLCVLEVVKRFRILSLPPNRTQSSDNATVELLV